MRELYFQVWQKQKIDYSEKDKIFDIILNCGIEDASEIPKEIFSYSVIGLTAGASTPDFIIDEVEKKLLEG